MSLGSAKCGIDRVTKFGEYPAYVKKNHELPTHPTGVSDILSVTFQIVSFSREFPPHPNLIRIISESMTLEQMREYLWAA